MLNLTGDEIHEAIAKLDQAIYNHEQWYKNLQRVLIARVPPDEADLLPDACHRCRFGQWYDGTAAEKLGEHAGFVAIGFAHQQMHEGATRLLQKNVDGIPIESAELDRFNNLLDRLRLEIQSLRGELAEAIENRDPLTDARNRAGLLSDLRQQQALVRRGLQECALVMMDLDHFKEVNDTHGHGVGDAVLSRTSECIRGELRPYDRVYRYGGEEFLLLMPQDGVSAAADVAERLRQAVAAQEIEDSHAGQSIRVTASFGVGALDPERPVEESIDQADQAMYAAKRAGRNRVSLAS